MTRNQVKSVSLGAFNFLVIDLTLPLHIGKFEALLTLFDMGSHDAPPQKNVFDHCAQMLWRRKLKLGDL